MNVGGWLFGLWGWLVGDLPRGILHAIAAFNRTVINFSADELAAWAGVLAAIFAAIGLIYTGRQTKLSVQAGELDQLIRMNELLDTQQKAHSEAFATGTDDEKAAATTDLLNTMELFAGSYQRKLVHGVGRQLVFDFITNLLAYLKHYKRDGELDEPSYPREWAYLRKFRKKHAKTVNKIAKDYGESLKKADASTFTSPASQTPMANSLAPTSTVAATTTAAAAATTPSAPPARSI